MKKNIVLLQGLALITFAGTFLNMVSGVSLFNLTFQVLKLRILFIKNVKFVRI